MNHSYRQKQDTAGSLRAIAFLLAVILALALSTAARAGELPSRPEMSTLLMPQAAGAFIELSIAGDVSASLWTVVQWQDGHGDWHDVSGWQGHPENGSKRWWVDPKDFADGPFRWLVQHEQGGETFVTSQPFYMPAESYQTVFVPVSAY